MLQTDRQTAVVIELLPQLKILSVDITFELFLLEGPDHVPSTGGEGGGMVGVGESLN